MIDVTRYEVPQGQLSLSGPVARPAPGTVPLRGDIAHIALAGTHLVPHYAVPQVRILADAPVSLRIAPAESADTVAELAGGSRFELLDMAGAWCWGALGPEGPSGWLPESALLPLDP